MKKLFPYTLIFLIVLVSTWLFLNREKGQAVENFEAFLRCLKKTMRFLM